MIRAQVVFGTFTALDLLCRRCEGRGKDPTCATAACLYCGGRGIVPELLGRAYTYDAPDGTKVWDLLQGDAVSPISGARETKLLTVVRVGSDYRGAVREAYPVPSGESMRELPMVDGGRPAGYGLEELDDRA